MTGRRIRHHLAPFAAGRRLSSIGTGAAVVAVLATAGSALYGFQTQPLVITHRARSVQPGEVVVLDVRAAGATDVRATVFDGEIRFYASPRKDLWHGLIGIDLEAAAGDYAVEIEATLQDGTRVTGTYVVSVVPKSFPTRELSVAPTFVNPPESELERIQREAATVAALFRTSSPARLWQGGFLRPVPGEATSSFGRRSVYNGQPRSPHSGTDFRAAEGTPIAAPAAGIIALAEEQFFSGNVVIIDHGWGLYSHLAHLSSIDVEEGDRVQQGQVIGRVGATGRVTGPHLHWTVRLNEARVDPIALMALLPAGNQE